MLVVAELKDGKLKNVLYEPLTFAQYLGTNGKVNAVLFGQEAADFLGDISKYGTNRLYVTNEQVLFTYTTDAYIEALAGIIEEVQLDIILMRFTAIEKDLAPRNVAFLRRVTNEKQ